MSQRTKTFLSILQKRKSFLWSFIVVITLLWGYAWVLMKEAHHYMEPFTFSSFRFGIGTITL
ncbi:EamA family transporter [Oceanobacillus bengalensis]|uniref:Uncharacterized protein n=1 Tax=Oceanobacillus bengalensis TaxID=1435466 RepID=A0A494Z780_9BACI|nr:EamA family transporter [Oceanobacillus bengalensis]RKQ18176.1 hypothetical protein D8M05_01880 [Oceanobacillus bengalensis]